MEARDHPLVSSFRTWVFQSGFLTVLGLTDQVGEVVPEPQGFSCLLFPSIGSTSAHLKQAAVLRARWTHSVWEDSAAIF